MKEDEYGVIRIAGHFDDSQSALVLHLRTQSHSIMKKHSHSSEEKFCLLHFIEY